MVNGKATQFKAGNKAAVGRGQNKELRTFVEKFLQKNVEAIQEAFDEAKPGEKLKFAAAVFPYVVPRLGIIQVQGNSDQPVTWNITMSLNGHDKLSAAPPISLPDTDY